MEKKQKLATELLEAYGSPLYVYDSEILQQTINHITEAILYPNTRFYFACVTNGNISLLRLICGCGWGLHANTPGDVFLGLQAGFNPQDIVYSGCNLNYEEMQQLLDWGVKVFNLDSLSQLSLFCQVYTNLSSPIVTPRLGLRLNYGDSRIGVRFEDFTEAIAITQSVGLKVSGLHFYRGTGTNSTKAFIKEIEYLLNLGKQLPDWEYLDFGGGFGYDYSHQGINFDWQWFGRELERYLNGSNIKLMIEPGRSAIAPSGTLLTRVVSVKWIKEKQIVGVDSTIANLAVLAVHGGYRKIVSFRDDYNDTYLTDVCGNTTYSRDYLGKNCPLPVLELGDILAILDVGAYGYAMSSHFLHRPRPAEVLLQNNQHRLIRKKEDYKILLCSQNF